MPLAARVGRGSECHMLVAVRLQEGVNHGNAFLGGAAAQINDAGVEKNFVRAAMLKGVALQQGAD